MNEPARFLILGSASPNLLRQSSESLAGRIEIIPVGGFSFDEVGASSLNRHWQRGGLPLSFLARTNDDSFAWRQQFIQTLLRDSGLLHVLLGIRAEKKLFTHPKIGASWEGYAIEEALSQFEPDQAHFWATHQGAELDLLLFKNGRRLGAEIKRADAPTMTPSLRSALADLKLEQLIVLYPGSQAYELESRVRVLPISALAGATVVTLFPKKRRVRAGSRSPS